jgi:hypothetical protein
VRTLEERVHSGRDIYQTLDLLRDCAKGEYRTRVLVQEVSFRCPEVAKPEDWEKAVSFQQARRAFVSGHVSFEVKDPSDRDEVNQARVNAVDLIKRYRLELERQGRRRGLVEEVKNRYNSVSEDQALLERHSICRLEFVHEIVLDEPGKAGAARSGAGKMAAGRGGGG